MSGVATAVVGRPERAWRDALRRGLAAGGARVVGEAVGGPSAAALVEAQRPDLLVLCDSRDAPLERSLALIRASSSPPATLVVGSSRDVQRACALLRAGAAAYLLADAAVEQLPIAVWFVIRGRRYLDPEVGASLAIGERPVPRCDGLTARQVEILRFLALGHTNAEIARQLFVSVRTVETHRAHIQERLGVSARAQLVRYAIEHGVLDPGPAAANPY